MRWRQWVAGGVVAASLAAVRSPRAQRYDRRIGTWLARPMGSRADTIISAATELGSSYAVAGLSGALAAVGRRRLARRVAVGGTVAWFGAQAAKRTIDRRRPFEAHGVTRLVTIPAGGSWPSGHVAVAAAMASAVADVLPRSGRLLAAALAGFVAHSRIYVGVHYLSDVLAGLGLGVLADRLTRSLASFAPGVKRPLGHL